MQFYSKDPMWQGGGMKSQVKVVLRNPLKRSDQIDYTIEVQDHVLAHDWSLALKKLLQSGKLLEKNFCFMGFPNTARDLPYLCDELNQAVTTINSAFSDYQITESYTPDTVVGFDYADNGINHDVLNRLHNHFEVLQGTVWKLSDWYLRADYETKYAIRQLNNLCHEMENLILSQRKAITAPYWVRPSQITTWLAADRYDLRPEHKQGFVTNGYDRVLGGVYMHWTQIGKTLFEVFRDEGAPELTATVCEAITHLRYYSGEFDIDWGNDVVYGGQRPWHDQEQDRFRAWLVANQLDPTDPDLSLGYLPVAQVQLAQSFGTTDAQEIWNTLGSYLDIYTIEIDGVAQKFDYCWTDPNYKQQQIDKLKPGYDYSQTPGGNNALD
jgi:hypothetical protein